MKSIKKLTVTGLLMNMLGHFTGLLLLSTALYYTYNGAMPLLNRWWPLLNTDPVTWGQAMIWTLFIRFIRSLLVNGGPNFKD